MTWPRVRHAHLWSSLFALILSLVLASASQAQLANDGARSPGYFATK